ncbi:MAG: hypothetical protein ACF8R7_12370 [Phycisphaerales bacterium JB039]
MPTALPRNTSDRIWFFRILADQWAELADPAAAIGVSPAQVAQLEAVSAEALEAYRAALAAREAAQAATAKLSRAMSALGERGGALVGQVRAHARTTGDDNVYAAARIPAPKAPSPAPAPRPPRLRGIDVKYDGALEITWDVTQPAPGAQVHTQIERALQTGDGAGNIGPWRLLAVTSAKRYLDRTVPAGTWAAHYRLGASIGARRPTAWSAATMLPLGSLGHKASGAQGAQAKAAA